jgi:hypothetical protein
MTLSTPVSTRRDVVAADLIRRTSMRKPTKSHSPYVRYLKAPFVYSEAYRSWKKAASYPTADEGTLERLRDAHHAYVTGRAS